MRISLICGENTTKAYNRYRELVDNVKAKKFEVIEIKNPREVVNQSLFADKTVFVLANSKEIKAPDWKWLGENNAKLDVNLIIYFEGNAPVSVIKNLGKNIKIEKLDLPKTIFAFLDNIYPGNAPKVLKLFGELVETESVEFVMFMLARQMRDLYWAKISEESMEMPDWKVLKLRKQADKFSVIGLQSLIKRLALIDMASKTGEGNLRNMLAIWIVESIK